MKKNKLDLKQLHVQSFITDKKTLNGGRDTIISIAEPTPATHCFDCPPTDITQ